MMAGISTMILDIFQYFNIEYMTVLFKDNVGIRTGLVFVACLGIWLLMRKPQGIPPGPRFTLPILGDMLYLKGEEDLRVVARRLRKEYGDICSAYFGSKLFIFLNSYGVIKEALVKNGDIFSNRPSLFWLDLLNQRKGIGQSQGQPWKEQRKFALETLREFGFGRTILEDKIHEEIGYLVEVIRQENGEKFDMFRLSQKGVSNIISSMVYGKRFEYDDPVFTGFLGELESLFQTIGFGSVLNVFPFLRYLPGDLFKYHSVLNSLDFIKGNIIIPSINEHMKNFDENHVDDYICTYIREMKKVSKTGQPSYLNEDQLVASIFDLFVAGTETTSTTILWTILYFLHHPNIQDKCYKEIQDVVGSGRPPSVKDKPSLPYVEAVILEVLRKANIALAGIPHAVNEDTRFHGYQFPKDAIIIPNLDAVLTDDKIWGDADVFRPERFIDSNGQVIKKDELIPFSTGRRICLGESLAKMELFLFVTTLVQRFEFKPVDQDNLPTLQGVVGITHAPAKYQVRALPR
ncbi:cytochrome P450 2B4 [Patella vulgata]|uniref:cytochrome P450 2B4 n=1 Tax=Patella vulgata TaxID=6465 RepID=UPI002180213A|nr:cytochrome P450 2B4 [Patella vulgata]